MKLNILNLLVVFLASISISAQTTISTQPYTSNGFNGSNGLTDNVCITFAIENTNSYAIALNKVKTIKAPVIPYTPLNNATFTLLYSATSLSDTANLVTTAWQKIDTVKISTLSAGYNTIFGNLNFIIPANTTYRFALQSTNGLAYSGGYPNPSGPGATPTILSPSIISENGVNLLIGNAQIAGKDVGWMGNYPYLGYNLCWFTGEISFTSTVACTSPPNAGNTVATITSACKNVPFTLKLSGNTFLAQQTYQWQSSDNGTSWIDISGEILPSLTTKQTTSTYYRCKVTCAGNSAFSVPVQITTPTGVSGNFTINQGAPTNGSNFNNFTDAVNYISCGINGPVVFNVLPSSGPYYEQVLIPFIGGTSATNTITFKGNGEQIYFQNATANNKAALTLNDADHIIIDSLNINCGLNNYSWGVLLTNNADSNIIRNCTIISNSSITIAGNCAGVVMSNSAANLNAFGNNGSGNSIMNNKISGGEYGIILTGGGINNNNNIISKNTITDFYRFGIYTAYQTNTIAEKNDIYRPQRTSASSVTGGIQIGPGTTGILCSKNKIHNLFDAMSISTATTNAIFVTGAANVGNENKVINNLMYNIGGIGAQTGICNMGGANMQAYHNTIIIDDGMASASECFGIWQLSSLSAANISVVNNIIYVAKNGLGTRSCMSIDNMNSITSNNNAFFLNCPNNSDTSFVKNGTLKYLTLASWKAIGRDLLSVYDNPAFTNPSIQDYTPTAATINDIGDNKNILVDILDSVRSTHPDPGAYEFSPTACSNPVGAGSCIASVTDVCPNTFFGLSLINNSVGNGQSYQWQSSANNVSFINLSSPTPSSLFTGTQTTSNYYRCAVQCGNGSVAYSSSVLVSTTPSLSGTYTINNTIPTGNGNFNSFNDAITSLQCGVSGSVIFNVTPNTTYNEHIIIPNIPGTSATNTVTFNGNGSTLTYNALNQNYPACIILNGADHIIFDSLIIDASSSSSYSYGILLLNQSDSNIIRKCTINVNSTTSSSSSMGIILNGRLVGTGTSGNNGNYNQILDNTIIGGYNGIYLFGTQYASGQNINNIIRRNKIQDFYTAGIYVSYMSSGCEITDNDLSRPNRSSSYGFASGGITLSTGCIGVLVERNRIHDLFASIMASTASNFSIYVSTSATPSQPNIIQNNLIYGFSGLGSHYGIYCLSTTNYCNIYHNTIVMDDQAATTGTTYGFYQRGNNVLGINFKNNLVYNVGAGSGTKRCISIGDTAAQVISNNNILFVVTGGNNAIGQVQNIDYASLNNWKNARKNSSYDTASISIDPTFSTTTSNDFTPTIAAADNIGTYLNVQKDFFGTTRSNITPDAGAIEFGNITILPSTAIKLNGYRHNSSVVLKWDTYNEINCKNFEIQISKNFNQFETVASIATKSLNGNSNGILSYEFNHNNSTTNKNYYRIKQIDINNRVSFSNTIAISGIENKEITITDLYPNPFKNELTFNLTSLKNYSAKVSITDIYGRVITTQTAPLKVGENKVTILLSDASAGIYTLTVDGITSKQIIKL